MDEWVKLLPSLMIIMQKKAQATSENAIIMEVVVVIMMKNWITIHTIYCFLSFKPTVVLHLTDIKRKLTLFELGY